MCCDGRNNSMISYAMISRSGGRKCNEDSIEMCSMDGNMYLHLLTGWAVMAVAMKPLPV